jgi:ATP-dependent Clp protease ATP-binding subunit ClpA
VFERFTATARNAVIGAQAEARNLRHGYIGTEHLLIGIADGPGVAAQILSDFGIERTLVRARIIDIVGGGMSGGLDADALRSIGIDLEEVRRHVEEAFGPGALEAARWARARPRRRLWKRHSECAGGAHVPFTPRAKKVLELSLRESLQLKDNFIGSEHVLLGILREGQGVAAMILAEQSLDYETARSRLQEGRRRNAG